MITGKLPASALRFVQGTIRLETLAAAAWKRLVADVREETGVTLTISGPDGGYRSFTRQKQLSGKGNHQYQPGGSIHGLGRSVDIWNWATLSPSRLATIAARHGFRRTIASELWHYEYSPNLDRSKPTAKKEQDVTYIQLIKIKNDPKDRQKSVWEKFTPAGTVQLVGYDLAQEHNRQTGAPVSLDGTSKSTTVRKRIALVRQLWAIDQAAYRSHRTPVRPEDANE